MQHEVDAFRELPMPRELTLARAVELTEALRAALLAEQPCRVNLCEVEEIDAAGIQVLLSAGRTFLRAHLAFEVVDAPGKPWQQALCAAGVPESARPKEAV
jgi:ABC-type transporter Mla MlaB component